MTYTYSTKSSIEHDDVFVIDVADKWGIPLLTVIFDCSTEDHAIFVPRNMGNHSHQKLAEMIKGASDYLDSLVN